MLGRSGVRPFGHLSSWDFPRDSPPSTFACSPRLFFPLSSFLPRSCLSTEPVYYARPSFMSSASICLLGVGVSGCLPLVPCCGRMRDARSWVVVCRSGEFCSLVRSFFGTLLVRPERFKCVTRLSVELTSDIRFSYHGVLHQTRIPWVVVLVCSLSAFNCNANSLLG
ncbi:hypothetical protein DFP72DRAFT_928789 [Ephemerocybe angulata]|uniref:Uncharacterized protein n=1 Tax=Ephemerocybe angulata TaxID=980116 RepID=A0A8H6HDV7_9AGAR|nr:hypothetical protein DFP72DRAFT_939609 [Tulosesus angulatus]KAF6744461.1 hypothetical protein DFP72DRAFT_928789 [Tulosesus angulatus]